ncbi:uncharacterized protein B0H64DRAFT_475512 [Chaetomium fimeti]|uniref:Ring-like domain-containing protein n=1 Tax=Chaetomium fimeti TaxID=1854472 RepID=A0AAE0HCL8_9PEZI|nr:hypothetical protein B0H64DRAFT_475512 [Chaetomium fimeti]
MVTFFKKHKEAEKPAKEADNRAGTENPAEQSQAKSAAADAIPPAISARDNAAPLLDHDDERFLERLISNDHDDDDNDDEGPRPPLPPRPKTPDLVWEDSDLFHLPKTEEGPSTAATTTTTATATAEAPKKPSRFSRLFHRKPTTTSTALTVPSGPTAVPPQEAEREWDDLNHVLARLGIEPTDASTTTSTTDSTTNTPKDASTAPAPTPPAPGKAKTAALAASAEVQSLLRQFVIVLKDVMRGAPTAVDDLTALLDGRNDVLKRGFEKLPSSMQKLVTQLPKKLTSSLGPEVLAAAAEAQGLKRDTDASGLARFLVPKNLGDLVLTPAIVKSMLKAIVNALKLRWPAFVGMNVLWSVAVFLLLFVLWYFHKRGKEEREKMEKEAAGEGVDDGEAAGKEVGEQDKVEEVEEGMSSALVVVEPPAESPRS